MEGTTESTEDEDLAQMLSGMNIEAGPVEDLIAELKNMGQDS